MALWMQNSLRMTTQNFYIKPKCQSTKQTSTTATMLSINRHPDHRVPLQRSSIHTQNAIANSRTKRGPKPKPLTTHLRYAAAAQRVERSYNREKKLRVVRYWLYALVTDEKTSGQRHVTRKEVSVQFLIPEATLSGRSMLRLSCCHQKVAELLSQIQCVHIPRWKRKYCNAFGNVEWKGRWYEEHGFS